MWGLSITCPGGPAPGSPVSYGDGTICHFGTVSSRLSVQLEYLLRMGKLNTPLIEIDH